MVTAGIKKKIYQRNNIEKGAHIRLIKQKESSREEISIDNSKNYQKNICHWTIEIGL